MAFPFSTFSKSLFNSLTQRSVKPKKRESRKMRPSLMLLEDRLVLDTGLAGNSLPLNNMQPYLALNYLVAQSGFFPEFESPIESTADLGAPVLGEVTLFAGNFAPSGYALAQGQFFSVNQFTALFALMGTNFGGNGRTNFAIPDLRGRAPVGAGNGSGLTPTVLGQIGGAPTVTATIANLPAHDHQLLNPATNPPTVTGATGSTGTGTPQNNLMPTLGLNYQVVTASSFDYLGEVALFTGSLLTDKAQGQLLPISSNNPLFNKIGTTFGGDGVTNFALPDLQGRLAVGSGSSPGISTYTLGQTGGTETVALTTSNLAAHQHLQLDTNTPTSLTGGTQPFTNLQPFNTLTYAICTSGVYPTQGNPDAEGEPFLGQIKMFSSNSLPNGFLPCDGRSLQVNQNQVLFSILGNFYGGDGINNFNLPDLRGRVPIGAGQDSFGNNYVLGQYGGTEMNTMTTNTMAAHTHTTPAIVSITTDISTASESVSTNLVSNLSAGRAASAVAGNQLVYSITRDSAQGGGTVRLDISGNASPADYNLAVSSGAAFTVMDANTIEITFPADALEVTLTATAIQDREAEIRESLIFTLVPGQNFLLHFSQGSATGFILDAEPLLISGGGSGSNASGTEINFYSQPGSLLTGSIVPYPGFKGEVRVSRADTTGDGIPEFITAPGQGGGPVIQVMNAETGAVISSFLAYDAKFRGGVFVALSDINQDGHLDFITSPGAGGGPHIKVFNGVTPHTEIASFFAFDQGFRGGASVAAFDVDGDGKSEIVVGAGPSGGPHVRVFSGLGHALVKEFFAYDASFTGGVFVAIGDIGLDGRLEIITGPGAGGGPHVKMWDYQTLTVVKEIMAFSNPTFQNGLMVDFLFQGGVRVGVVDFNGDGFNDVVVGAGPSGGPRVQVYSGIDFSLLGDFFSGDPDNRDGVFVS